MGHFVVLFFSHPGAIRLAILGFFVGHGGILSHPNNPLLALVFLLVNSPLIPGKTRVLSTTVFDHVEVMEYTQAHIISAGMLLFSFLVLLGVYIVNRRFPIHVS